MVLWGRGKRSSGPTLWRSFRHAILLFAQSQVGKDDRGSHCLLQSQLGSDELPRVRRASVPSLSPGNAAPPAPGPVCLSRWAGQSVALKSHCPALSEAAGLTTPPKTDGPRGKQHRPVGARREQGKDDRRPCASVASGWLAGRHKFSHRDIVTLMPGGTWWRSILGGPIKDFCPAALLDACLWLSCCVTSPFNVFPHSLNKKTSA